MAPTYLTGKLALITGAGQGLGKAIAESLGKAGARLALVARNRERLQEAASSIAEAGGEAEAFPADVSNESDVQRLEQEIRHRLGSVSILVNNAGINLRKGVTEFTFEEWQRVIETNLHGPFLMTRAFVPHMKGRGYGRIINLTSIMSHVALPERTAYATTKTGLLGFTRALALELASEAITVNAISPGPFGTQMNQPIMEDPERNAQFLSKIPLQRWGRIEEVGELALYLCSENAGFITGTDIVIDGGWCAQ